MLIGNRGVYAHFTIEYMRFQRLGDLNQGSQTLRFYIPVKEKNVIMRQAYVSCPLTVLNTTSYHQCLKTKEYFNYNNRKKKDPYLRRKSLKLNKFSLREN